VSVLANRPCSRQRHCRRAGPNRRCQVVGDLRRTPSRCTPRRRTSTASDATAQILKPSPRTRRLPKRTTTKPTLHGGGHHARPRVVTKHGTSGV
jgi:hypothetical protein